MTTRPSAADVRAWVRLSPTQLSDADLAYIYAGCVNDQEERCTIPDDPNAFPDALALSLLRRAQREIAARNLPLGIVGPDGEFGPQRIATYDALIEAHERPYLRQVLA